MAEKREPIGWITVNGAHVPLYDGESKQDAVNKALSNQKRTDGDEGRREKQIAANKKTANEKNGKTVTAKDIEQKLIKENSYTNDPKYQKLKNEVTDAYKRKQKYTKKAEELEAEIEKESSPKPKDEWDTSDEILAMLGEKPSKYTERGEQLQKEYREAKEEAKKAGEEWSEKSRKLRALDEAQHDKQKQEWNISNKDISTNVKDEYPGFKVNESTTPYIDRLLKEGKAKVIEMSPEAYLHEIAHNIFDRGTLETSLRAADVENVNKYMQMMRDGTKFDTPYLNYRDKEQEGRHRAIAAMMLGIERIPVIVVRK